MVCPFQLSVSGTSIKRAQIAQPFSLPRPSVDGYIVYIDGPPMHLDTLYPQRLLNESSLLVDL
jgi:hypothetical protein